MVGADLQSSGCCGIGIAHEVVVDKADALGGLHEGIGLAIGLHGIPIDSAKGRVVISGDIHTGRCVGRDGNGGGYGQCHGRYCGNGGGNKATCMAHARHTTSALTLITEATHETLNSFATPLTQLPNNRSQQQQPLLDCASHRYHPIR